MTTSLAITTPRLSLRPPTLDDFEASAAMWGDPIVTRYIGGKPSTREDAWHRLLRYVGHWTLLDCGFFVARDRATGEFVGEVGVGDFHREGIPAFEGTWEAGWVLANGAHGRGLATEAMQAVLGWFDAKTSGARTVCMIDAENAGSRRIAEKIGYRFLEEATYKGARVGLFERNVSF